MTVRVSKPAFNIREKVSELDKPTGLKGSELMRSDTSQDVRNLIGAGRKNLIINGSMQVAQRGTSDTSSGYYTTVDRWNNTVGGLDENVTRSQESLSSSDTGPYEKGFRNAWKFVNGNQTSGGGAADYIIPQYAIEAQDLANSGWNYKSASSYITLSFWVKSSVAQTFYGFLRTIAGTDQAWSFNYTLSANTWTKVTKTIPGLSNGNIDINDDNTNGMSIMLPIFLGTDRTDSSNVEETWAAYSGSNRTKNSISGWYTTNDATWHLTGVQLEVGSEATSFEHRTYAEELQLCQRYYEKWGNFITGTGTGRGPLIGCYSPGTSGVANGARFFGWLPMAVRKRTSSPTITEQSILIEHTSLGNSSHVTQIGCYMQNSGPGLTIEANALGGYGVAGDAYHLSFYRPNNDAANVPYIAIDSEL